MSWHAAGHREIYSGHSSLALLGVRASPVECLDQAEVDQYQEDEAVAGFDSG